MYCILSYFLMHMYTLNTICETYLKFVELIMKWSFLQQSMAVWNFWTCFDHLRCLSDCPCFTLQIWWPLVEYAALVFVSKALKALGTLVVVFERECLKVEWCAGRCSHKQAKKINCPQFCSSGYVVGLSWTLQCLSMVESWNFLRSSVWMILSGYTLWYSNVLEHHHQNNKISCQLQAGHLYHFVNCTATNTSGPIPGQEAQSLVYIRVQQAARLGHRDLEFPKPTSSIYAAYHNPVLVGKSGNY